MKFRRLMPLGCAALSMVMFAGTPMLPADDAPATAPATQPASATGTVTITVTDSSGNAVTDARVRLINAANMQHGQHNRGQGGQGGNNGQRPKPIEATLGSDGKYTATVPVGDYMVVANEKAGGRGREKVAVAANATATVSITLKPAKNANN